MYGINPTNLGFRYPPGLESQKQNVGFLCSYVYIVFGAPRRAVLLVLVGSLLKSVVLA